MFEPGGGGSGNPSTVTTVRPQTVSGQDIVNIAAAELGDPYRFGATGPNEWDCSSLVQHAYRSAGIDIPRTTFDMVAQPWWENLKWESLQPGDLVFSNWGYGGPNSHMGIYAGNNRLLEAGSHGVAYQELDANYRAHVNTLRRVPGVTGYTRPLVPTGADIGAGVSPADDTRGGYTGGLPNPLDPDQVRGFLGGLPVVSDVTSGLSNISKGIGVMAGGVASMGKLASLATKLFLPSTLLRGFFLMLGLIFVLVGIWFLASEAREA